MRHFEANAIGVYNRQQYEKQLGDDYAIFAA
jgi:hypothetical protein